LVPLLSSEAEASDESRLGAHLAAPDAILDACSAARALRCSWSALELKVFFVHTLLHGDT
jgi:hypothetical protein